MTLQALIDRLESLGMATEEAAVYVHLTMMGPAKTSDVAERLDLNRTDAYRTLQALVDRGMAVATDTRPVRYEAAPPGQLFRQLLAAHLDRSQRIASAAVDLSSALAALRGPESGSAEGTFKSLEGRSALDQAVDALARDAKRSFRMLFAHPQSTALVAGSGLLEGLAARAREGLDVRLLLTTDAPARERLRALSRAPGPGVRHLDASARARLAIADERALVMWVHVDPSAQLSAEGDEGLWSDAPDLVRTEAALFDAAWAQSKELDKMLAVDRLEREGYFRRGGTPAVPPGESDKRA